MVDWFDREGSGAVLRHYEDAGTLGGLRALVIRDVMGPAMILVVLLPGIFILQPWLALSRLAAVVPAMITGMRFLDRDLACEQEIWQEKRRIATSLVRGARGIATLKVFHAVESYFRAMRKGSRRLSLIEEDRGVLTASWEALAGWFSRLGGALTLVLAVLLLMKGRLTFGCYIGFSILSMRAISALGELITGIRGLARGGNAALRHLSLFLQQRDGVNHAINLGSGNSNNLGLIVTGLGFAYPHGRTVIRNLNLRMERGERVLITGESGAGKSTLLHLLLGFLKPQAGRIEFAGRSLDSCRESFSGNRVGAVLQTPVFFDGSIRDNLCMFSAPLPDRHLWAALETADADDIVSGLPGGLDFRLQGDDGGLSGGQRQRLAIARMLLYSPDLILLDEPVNSLDPRSMAVVMKSLSSACSGRTVLLISHGESIPIAIDRQMALSGGFLLELRSGVNG